MAAVGKNDEGGIGTIKGNGTWKLVSQPVDKKVIRSIQLSLTQMHRKRQQAAVPDPHLSTYSLHVRQLNVSLQVRKKSPNFHLNRPHIHLLPHLTARTTRGVAFCTPYLSVDSDCNPFSSSAPIL